MSSLISGVTSSGLPPRKSKLLCRLVASFLIAGMALSMPAMPVYGLLDINISLAGIFDGLLDPLAGLFDAPDVSYTASGSQFGGGSSRGGGAGRKSLDFGVSSSGYRKYFPSEVRLSSDLLSPSDSPSSPAYKLVTGNNGVTGITASILPSTAQSTIRFSHTYTSSTSTDGDTRTVIKWDNLPDGVYQLVADVEIKPIPVSYKGKDYYPYIYMWIYNSVAGTGGYQTTIYDSGLSASYVGYRNYTVRDGNLVLGDSFDDYLLSVIVSSSNRAGSSSLNGIYSCAVIDVSFYLEYVRDLYGTSAKYKVTSSADVKAAVAAAGETYVGGDDVYVLADGSYLTFDANKSPVVYSIGSTGQLDAIMDYDASSGTYNCDLYGKLLDEYLALRDQIANQPTSTPIPQPTTPPSDGGSSGDSSGGGLGDILAGGISELIGMIGSLLGGVLTGIIELITGLISGLTDVIPLMGDVAKVFSSFFAYLPESWQLILTSAFSISMVVGVLRIFGSLKGG